MSKTKIEWAEKVWNPVTGCTKVSPGCANCYAERIAKRLAGRCGYPEDEPFRVTLHPERMEEPLRWKKSSKIFVCSMSDLFHEDVPFEFIIRVWATMLSVACMQHTFFILTKRAERMREFYQWVQDRIRCGIFGVEFERDNIWLGVTAENQEQAGKRIPILLQIPAAVRFVSAEPMLSEIKLTHLDHDWQTNALTGTQSDMGRPWIDTNKIDWVICGGESGPGARPLHPDWVRSLRDQCQAAGVPFFFKQWGNWIAPSQMSDATYMDIEHFGNGIGISDNPLNVGKKKAGRILDGRTWDQFPEVGV